MSKTMMKVNKSTFFVEIKLMIPINTCGITPVNANSTVATLNQKLDFNPYLAYNRKNVDDHANTSRLTNIAHLFSSKKTTFKTPFHPIIIQNEKARGKYRTRDNFSQAFILPCTQKNGRPRLVTDGLDPLISVRFLSDQPDLKSHGTLENLYLFIKIF